MRRGALLILLASICFAAYVLYGLATVEPVKVTGTRLIRNGDQVSVEGEVRNTGEASGPVEIEVRYFDANGHALGRDTVSIGSIQRDAATTFKSPARRLDGVADFSIYLNHGKNPYGN
ncbi:MAG TPA: FxLYD domain-containing protein [Candidatus Acidoferrales bacterium]|nr:FxLYD domain-containing protein [Candidatus Acidoferrales bacterium]